MVDELHDFALGDHGHVLVLRPTGDALDMVMMAVGQENGLDRRLPAELAQSAFGIGRSARIDQHTAAVRRDKVRIAGVLFAVDVVDDPERIVIFLDKPCFERFVGGRDKLDPVRVLGEQGFDEDRSQVVEILGFLVGRDLVDAARQRREIQVMTEQGVVVTPGKHVNFPALQSRNDERRKSPPGAGTSGGCRP